MACIFCMIANKEIPGKIVYEDDLCLAFLDLSQTTYGHTLVIPKKHVTNVLDCDEETLKHVMTTVKKVSDHYANLGYEGVNIMNASGEAAQQTVFHLHFHIIPRKKDDKENTWPELSGAKEDLETTHQKLKF